MTRKTLKPTLKAVIFDFNGVIINDEPIHLKMFQKVLKKEGIHLSDPEYYKKYLAYDDQSCFEMILREHRKLFTQFKINSLIRKKARYYRIRLRSQLPIFPGVKKWVKIFSRHFPLAIASAALGEEIRWILRRAKLLKYFKVIVSAEEVSHSKPHPESFKLALARLNPYQTIRPEECLVIEDSIAGIKGARRAGMRCLALAHTYPQNKLAGADMTLPRLTDLRPAHLKRIFTDRSQ